MKEQVAIGSLVIERDSQAYTVGIPCFGATIQLSSEFKSYDEAVAFVSGWTVGVETGVLACEAAPVSESDDVGFMLRRVREAVEHAKRRPEYHRHPILYRVLALSGIIKL